MAKPTKLKSSSSPASINKRSSPDKSPSPKKAATSPLRSGSPTKKSPRKAPSKVIAEEKSANEKESANASSEEEDEDAGVEYEVEAIVGMKHSRKEGTIYRVKWKGWPSKHNTWQPENTMNCPDLIKDYHKGLKKVKENKNKKTQAPALKTVHKKRKTDMDGKEKSADDKNAKAQGFLGGIVDTLKAGFWSENRAFDYEPDLRKTAAKGSWEKHVDHVRLVNRIGDKLYFKVYFIDDKIVETTNQEVNIRCPQAVIKFYESKVNFN